MEFTCMWSKDAQQKKRKRWTDGVARFFPSTGVLSIWDQDASAKVSSTRLKPEEAAAVLQEDGDEARVGGISLQIMAAIQQQQQRSQDATAAASTAETTVSSVAATGGVGDGGGGGSGKEGIASRLGGLAAGGSGFRRGKLGAARRSLQHATGPLASGSSSSVSAGAVARTADASSGTSAAGSVKRTGFGGAGRGIGGARRFHAPRSFSSGTAAQATSNANPPASSSARRETGSCGSAGPAEAGEGPSDFSGASHGSGASAAGANTATAAAASAVAKTAPGGFSGNHKRGDTHAAGAAASPEGLVLEWTAGDPPRPLLAGASLARRLHPHQREGLKVLWECLAGRGGYEGRGAILADEMGLGKTATAIALCTCVLRHRRAECLKAVVVCPSSLVRNWANEFKKWCPLGANAVPVDQAGAAAAQLVADFKIGAPSAYPILVISYELYRNHGKVINATSGLGLLIADEGHRLKNSSETKTTRALKACPAVMRLVLTGTPMQNDLDEFFAVADFVNPGLLGSLKSFRSRYTRPIKAAWDRDADEDVADFSTERTRELAQITGKFVLRRTKDVIRGSLPPASEVVIFCRPSARQLSLYESCIASSADARSLLYGDAERGGGGGGGGRGGRGAQQLDGEGELEEEEEEEEEEGGDGEESEEDGRGKQQQQQQKQRPVSLQGVLPLISTLRRLCNHPDLVAGTDGVVASGGGGLGGESNVEDARDDTLGELRGNGGGKENSRSTVTASRAAFKRPWKVPRSSGGVVAAAAAMVEPRYETEASGKLLVLEALLKAVRREFPCDKVVVTSNFTSALDVLEKLAERNAWGFLRLDGGTPTNSRQNLVDRFNKAPPENAFLFFLSAKAGGVGLNLVGANRIVLFDSDWNPATDDQAMARVWRLGQTKKVWMYRLLSTGTLEESIFQRQIFKGALYDLIQDSNEASGAHSSSSTGAVDKRSSSSSSSSNGSGSGSTQQMRGKRGGGDDEDSLAAAAAAKGGGAQSSNRGFSQEELKELFVLKTETTSDTYDKLRRRRVASAAAAAAATATTTAPEGNSRYEQTTAKEPGEERGEGTGQEGDGVIGAALTPVGGEWKDYLGPSEVLDKALRLALLEETTGTDAAAFVGDRGGSANNKVATAASSAVTFVREVPRGGEPKQQQQQQQSGAEAASRSPFAPRENACI